jgi:hypothetical protein
MSQCSNPFCTNGMTSAGSCLRCSGRIYANCLQGLRTWPAFALRRRVMDAIPSNWCDPLLTGPEAINFPAKCPDIERLLNGVRERVRHALNGNE